MLICLGYIGQLLEMVVIISWILHCVSPELWTDFDESFRELGGRGQGNII